jgi:hypothetical protein
MNWNLQCGVIIIGSLLWQDYLKIKDDNIRLDWRNSSLDMNNKIPIRIPIRYGRISKSGIVTMVYSNRMKNKMGFAYVVPFKNRINNIDELAKELEGLSIAEGMNGSFVSEWGILSYLINGNIMVNIKNEIIRFFIKRKNLEFIIDDYKVYKEKSCITKSLKLNIDWLKPIDCKDNDRLNQFDFLFGIATKPTNRLLNYDEIAIGIKNDLERKYFINNIMNGIITQEDFKISMRIEQ